MDKFIDFIVNNKFMIAVIILVALIIIIGVSEYTNKNNEGMEVASLSKFVNKEINLKYSKNGTTYYLAIAPRASCDNIKQDQNDCINNVVILQKVPNEYTKMLLSFNPYSTPSRYNIVSTTQLSTQQLSHNINNTIGNKMCFESNTDDDIISFEIEEKDGKYAMKYRKELIDTNSNGSKKYSYYYIGECDDPEIVCEQAGISYNRLCVFEDQSKAIYFEIDSAL